jgi:outer membrane protein assembly factor BamA
VKFFSLIISLIFCLGALSQTPKVVYFHLDKKTEKINIKTDSVNLLALKEEFFLQYEMLGYVGLSVKDSLLDNNKLHYYLNFEEYFKHVILKNKNKKTVTDLAQTPYHINKQLIQLENSGFPFAKIRITKQSIENNKLVIDYKIDSGAYFIIDKIHIKSQNKFNKKTILNLINLSVGEAYNESKLKQVDAILKSSNLYALLRAPEVLFFNGKAEVYIYIEKQKSSTADGYVGLLQDKNTQKVSLNGYINLKLKNTLNRAELLNMNWKANPDKTQKLLINVDYPFLFNSPFGVSSDLDLHKQDTTFVRSNFIYGVNYQQSFFKIGIFNQLENSFLIDTNYQKDFRTYSKNTLGINFLFEPFFVNQFNFYRPKLEVSTGFFKYKSDSIVSNTSINNIKFYSELSQQFKFLNYFSYNNNLSYQFVQSGYNLSRNELIYFGGLKSLRGFYELELNGNNVFIVQNEIEYQPLPILSFKVLYDYSIYSHLGQNYTNSFGFGFGLLSENSKLEIIVANGTVNNSGFALSNTKIHIGFSSHF